MIRIASHVRRRVAPATVMLGMMVTAGCSNSPPVGDVTGNVTLDGRQVVTGTIHFEPASGKGPTASEVVKDGRYAVRLVAHAYRVRISAPDLTPPPGPMPPTGYIPAEIVPARYNARTELTADVKPGPNSIDFALRREEPPRNPP